MWHREASVRCTEQNCTFKTETLFRRFCNRKTHKQYAIFLNLRFPPGVFPYSYKVLLRKAFSHAAWQSDSSSPYYTSSLTLKDINTNSSITFCFSLRKASLMQPCCLRLGGFWGATGWIWSPVFETRQSACTQESWVTFVSELFQLRLLCSSRSCFWFHTPSSSLAASISEWTTPSLPPLLPLYYTQILTQSYSPMLK